MNKIFTFYLVLILLISSISCNKNSKKEYKSKFMPEILSNIINLKANNKEDFIFFNNNWSPRLLNNKKMFYRYPLNKNSEINFNLQNNSSYVLKVDFYSKNNILNIKFNDLTLKIKKNKNIVIKKRYILNGKNRIIFLDKDFTFFNLKLIPIKFLKYSNIFSLIENKNLIFLPSKIQYFLKPINKEYLLIKFKNKNKINAEIQIKTNKNKFVLVKNINKNGVLKIKPIINKFQEITIKLSSKIHRNYQIEIKESLLISTKEENYKKKKIIKQYFKDKNILFIVLDASRWDHYSFNNYIRKTTPNIDKISQKSIVFSNTFSQASYTLASTGTLLTGLSPEFHNVISEFFSKLSPNITTISELLKRNKYKTFAISGNPNFSKAFAYDKGFDIFIELFKKKSQVLAEDFINPFKNIINQNKSNNFFAYLHIREPHQDFLMPEPFIGKFQKSFIKQSKEVQKFEYYVRDNIEKVTKKDIKLFNSLYDENLNYADFIFGKIIKILKTNKIFKKSVFFIFADHGEALGEHKLTGHGHVLYNQVIRIPLLLYIPEYKKRLLINDIKITSDIFKTICDFLEINKKDNKISYGKNLFDINPERRLFIRRINAYNRPAFAVLHFPYKLIIRMPFDYNNLELYNIEKDYDEKNNIKSKNPLIVKTLLFYLKNHLRLSSNNSDQINKPKLSKKDIKSLKSLGYL